MKLPIETLSEDLVRRTDEDILGGLAYLREIEKVLAGLPPVREAAVAGVPDLRRGEVQTHLLPPPEPRR